MPSIRQRHVLAVIIAQILEIVKFTKRENENTVKPVRIPKGRRRPHGWRLDMVNAEWLFYRGEV